MTVHLTLKSNESITHEYAHVKYINNDYETKSMIISFERYRGKEHPDISIKHSNISYLFITECKSPLK